MHIRKTQKLIVKNLLNKKLVFLTFLINMKMNF